MGPWAGAGLVAGLLVAGSAGLAGRAGPADAAPAGPVAAVAPAPGQRCAPPADTPYRPVPWAQRRLDPARVWMLTRGQGVTVAVLDTGVGRTAPGLRGRVLPGRDVVSGGRADDDCDGHGTFVAGLVAGRGTGGRATATGIAPDARILPVRVVQRAEDVHPDRLAQGIDAAVAGGASVIAVVATAPFGSPALTRAVARAGRSAVVVAAVTTARNQRGDGAYPAALPGVVSVMPLGPGGLPPGVRPAVPPSLSAPGMDLVSVGPAGTGNVVDSGANLAVGYVAGTAALVRAHYRAAGPAEVRARLLGHTDPVGGPAPDAVLGRGVLDPLGAVTGLVPGPGERRDDPPPERFAVPEVPVVSTRSADLARRWTVLALGAGAVAALAGAAVVRGRRRGWTAPGADPDPAAAGPPGPEPGRAPAT